MQDVTDFYLETLDPESPKELKPRPETKSLSDLERVIALGKPEAVVLKFASLVSNKTQWDWFDSYQAYLEDHEAWEVAKETFEPLELEDSEELTTFTEEEPIEPLRPESLTPSQVLEPYYATRRASAYPELSEFADGFVKAQAGDSAQLDAYVADCLAVKALYPKGL